MKTTMLEYLKVILRKVSFDKRLFRKEYRKSLRMLGADDARALRQWIRMERMQKMEPAPLPIKNPNY